MFEKCRNSGPPYTPLFSQTRSILIKLLISLLSTLILPFATSVHLLEILQEIRRFLSHLPQPESGITTWWWHEKLNSEKPVPKAVLNSECQLWKWIKLSCHTGEFWCSIDEHSTVAGESHCGMVAPILRGKHGASCMLCAPSSRELSDSSPAGGLHTPVGTTLHKWCNRNHPKLERGSHGWLWSKSRHLPGKDLWWIPQEPASCHTAGVRKVLITIITGIKI